MRDSGQYLTIELPATNAELVQHCRSAGLPVSVNPEHNLYVLQLSSKEVARF